MNKLPIILGVVVVIIFFICMNTKELFTVSPLNVLTGNSGPSLSQPYDKPLMTTSDEKLNSMNSDSFFNGTYKLCDKDFNPTNQNIEIIVFKRNYDLLFLVKSVKTLTNIGLSCISNDDCSSGICDTDNLYDGCNGLCLVPNRNMTEEASFNCPVSAIGSPYVLGSSDPSVTTTSGKTTTETTTSMETYYDNKKITCNNSLRIDQPCTQNSSCSASDCNNYCMENDQCNYAFSNSVGGCHLYSDCSKTRTPTYYGTTTKKTTTEESITAPSTVTITPSEELAVTDYRTYKTVKAKIIKNFKTTGTFLVSSDEPMSSFKANEVVNILPQNTEGNFGINNGVIYFTNNGITFMKIKNNTYETFTNYHRDTPNQYYTNIPNIVAPGVHLTTGNTNFKVQAKHSNSNLLNPILNLDITNNCRILHNITNENGFDNVIIFTSTDLTDNQDGKVFKSLGTQFFGPNNEANSLVLEVTDLTKYIHGTGLSDMTSAMTAFKNRLSILEAKEDSIAEEYMSCLNSATTACDYGSETTESSSNCTDLLPGEMYNLENEINSMELTQWSLKSMIKKEGANTCIFQLCTQPEYNTLNTTLWAEANNNGRTDLSLERGGARGDMTFTKNGKSQNWIFDEGEQIAGNTDIGLYRVKIRSTNGLYLTPSKSFQGLNDRTNNVVLTRDNSTWWYLLASKLSNFNTSTMTVLDNNLRMNALFVDDGTSDNSRTNYYCPNSHPYRYGSAEKGYYCSTQAFESDGTTSGTKCCLERGLSSSCQSPCCPTDVCPTDMSEQSETTCYPTGEVGSTTSFCSLLGTTSNKCYP